VTTPSNTTADPIDPGGDADAQAAALERLPALAERLAKAATSLGLPSFADSLRDDLRRRLEQRRLRVVVLGEIKHGKSTLINALVGQSLLPAGVVPTTAAIVRVRASSLTATSRDAEGARWYAGHEEATAERLDAAEFAERARGRGSAEGPLLAVVERGRLPEGIELVDTPGLNDIARFRSLQSRDELTHADAILLVLDATQVLTRSELELLRDAIRALGGLGASGARLEIVVTRVDLVGAKERGAIVEHLVRALRDVLGDVPDPILVDARKALASPDDADPTVRAIETIRRRLTALATAREGLLPRRSVQGLRSHAVLLAEAAALQARAVTLEEDTLTEEVTRATAELAARRHEVEHWRSEIASEGARIAAESRARIERIVGRLVEAALAEIASAELSNLVEVLPGALHDAFEAEARIEASRVREALDELSTRVIATYGEQAARLMARATLPLRFSGPEVQLAPPGRGIEAASIALGLAGTGVMLFGDTITGMVMTIASPLLAMTLRELSVRDARSQAQRLVPIAIHGAGERLAAAGTRAIERHGDRLTELVLLASDRLGEIVVGSLRNAKYVRAEASAHDVSASAGATTDTPSASPGAARDAAKAAPSGAVDRGSTGTRDTGDGAGDDGDDGDDGDAEGRPAGTSAALTPPAGKLCLASEVARRTIRELELEVADVADDLDAIALRFAPAPAAPTEHVIPEIPHDPTSRGGPSA
jgi:signal recognition particle receptor subunit beta